MEKSIFFKASDLKKLLASGPNSVVIYTEVVKDPNDKDVIKAIATGYYKNGKASGDPVNGCQMWCCPMPCKDPDTDCLDKCEKLVNSWI